MITGKTFTAQYDRREDRIRLTLNYAEPMERIDFMITRSMFLRLIPALERLLPEGAKAIRPRTPQSAGMDPTDTATLTLTENTEPLLLEKIDFQVRTKTRQVTLLFYGRSPEQPDAGATLSLPDLARIVGIILGAIPFIDWGIAPNILEM